MIKEFFIGLFQGLFLSMLLQQLNLGFLNIGFSFLKMALGSSPDISGIILFAVINILYFFWLSKKSIKRSPAVFIFGVVVGALFL